LRRGYLNLNHLALLWISHFAWIQYMHVNEHVCLFFLLILSVWSGSIIELSKGKFELFCIIEA
jgi:hypothetical protein